MCLRSAKWRSILRQTEHLRKRAKIMTKLNLKQPKHKGEAYKLVWLVEPLVPKF